MNHPQAFLGNSLDLVLRALPDVADCWVYNTHDGVMEATLAWLGGLSRVKDAASLSVI